MSRRTVAIAILLVVAGLPSLALGARTFRTEVPYAWEYSTAETLPIVLYDATGLVAEIRPGSRLSFDDPPVRPIDGSPTWLAISWLGGACDGRVTLVFGERTGGYRVTAKSDSTLLGMLGCPAVGILRTIEVRFTRDVAPNEVLVETRWN